MLHQNQRLVRAADSPGLPFIINSLKGEQKIACGIMVNVYTDEINTLMGIQRLENIFYNQLTGRAVPYLVNPC